MQNYVENCNVCLMFKILIWFYPNFVPAEVRFYIRLRSAIPWLFFTSRPGLTHVAADTQQPNYNCVSLQILFGYFFSHLTWHQNSSPSFPPSPIRSLFFHTQNARTIFYVFKKQLEDKQCISEASRDLPYYRFAHVGRALRTQRCTWKITHDGGTDGDGDGKDGDGDKRFWLWWRRGNRQSRPK